MSAHVLLNLFNRRSYGPRRDKNLSSGCPTKPVSNKTPQVQRLARILKVHL